jgi:hypothetical protein
MATNFTCSRALRVLGQTLEAMGVDLFEISSHEDSFYLQCGDPTPPHLRIVDLSYSKAELYSLDSEARTQRQAAFKTVDFNGLAELFRTLGRLVDSKDATLLRICNCESHLGQDTIKLEYETADGQKYVEELIPAELSDAAMRMYKDRGRSHQEHSRR